MDYISAHIPIFELSRLVLEYIHEVFEQIVFIGELPIFTYASGFPGGRDSDTEGILTVAKFFSVKKYMDNFLRIYGTIDMQRILGAYEIRIGTSGEFGTPEYLEEKWDLCGPSELSEGILEGAVSSDSANTRTIEFLLKNGYSRNACLIELVLESAAEDAEILARIRLLERYGFVLGRDTIPSLIRRGPSELTLNLTQEIIDRLPDVKMPVGAVPTFTRKKIPGRVESGSIPDKYWDLYSTILECECSDPVPFLELVHSGVGTLFPRLYSPIADLHHFGEIRVTHAGTVVEWLLSKGVEIYKDDYKSLKRIATIKKVFARCPPTVIKR